MISAKPQPTPEDPAPEASETHVQGPALRFVTMKDPNTAMGVAVRFMMDKPAFAKLTFSDWVGVLNGQISRGHYGLVIDNPGAVCGYMGWALATLAKAESWADGVPLSSADCEQGDCLIVNAWVEQDPSVHRFMVSRLRDMVVGKTAIYARRARGDGSLRTVRLPVDAFISGRAVPD